MTVTTYAFLLPALLGLAACNQSADNSTAASTAPTAGAAQATRPAASVPPAVPDLRLQPGSSGTFEVSVSTFQQLPASSLPTRPIRADSPDLARQPRVRRNGPRLVFKLDNGREAELKDVVSTMPDVRKHFYWGELPAAHQWVAHVGLWEGWLVALIDQRSGRVKYAWGQPFVSPDGHHLLTTSADLEANYDANGVQLFQVQADSLFQLGEREFKKQGPEAARWLNNHAVVLEMQESRLESGPLPPTYLGLELEATPATAQR